jgi:polar amino acid transport system permease protein
MTDISTARPEIPEFIIKDGEDLSLKDRLREFPWWFLTIILVGIWAAFTIATRDEYREVFNFVKAGLSITIITAILAYLVAIFLGLITGLGRISKNLLFSNLARSYIEMIRGIPMLVLIFFIALVAVPSVIDAINSTSDWFHEIGLGAIGDLMAKIENKNVSLHTRAVIALAVTYGAFLAEIFRAGIQSIGRGQMEAARSLGMTSGQAMRNVILPQAIRNVLPALGNDFVAMVKDSSLVSVLAVRDITQLARLYAGSSFRFRESYVTLAFLYLIMTILLSLVVQRFERWLRRNE